MKSTWWVALVAAMSVGAPAQAAVVTRSFNVTASTFGASAGAKAPFSSLSADITLTYDDAVSGFPVTLAQFRVTTDGRVNDGPFSATPMAGYFLSDAMRKVPRIVIGGVPSGMNMLTANENDFFIGFNDGQPGFTSVAFTMAGSQAGFLSQDARVRETTVTAAVPEPATWLMPARRCGGGRWCGTPAERRCERRDATRAGPGRPGSRRSACDAERLDGHAAAS